MTFRSNGTLLLEGLSVLKVQSKDFTNTPLPKWAIEKAWGYAVNEINPFWGLTNSALTNSSVVDVVEAEEIFLPATNRYVDYGKLYDTFAAGTAFGASWNSVYEYAAAVKGTSLNWIPSYGGENDFAQTQKWRQLSRTASGAAKILDLIWMDLAASAVVGTVTGFEPQSQAEQMIQKRDGEQNDNPVLGKRTVRRLVHRVGYSNILYAIPAMVLGVIALLTGLFLILMCCGKLYVKLMKFYINQVCVGRAIAQWEHPNDSAPEASSSQWKKTAGKRILRSIPEMPLKGKDGDEMSVDEILPDERYDAGSYVMGRMRGGGAGRYEPVLQQSRL